MIEARYYEKIGNNNVQCKLCPHNCIIREGAYGNCKIRVNKNGILYSTIYEKIVTLHLDPIEKKPFMHFLPKSKILSVGTAGCNFHCKFCQNYEISQCKISDIDKSFITNLSFQSLVELAMKTEDNIGIAFTYNEPFIWYEYVLDTSKLAKEKNLKTVMVTNGYINPEPLKELNNYIDAYSIDLKSYDNYLYEALVGGEIEFVIENIKFLIESGKHVEIDYLVIPNYNDNPEKFRELMIFYEKKFGKDIPIHINRYFPRYELYENSTSKEILFTFEQIAKEYLNNVYIGNIWGDKMEIRPTYVAGYFYPETREKVNKLLKEIEEAENISYEYSEKNIID